jgi:hypothetical protein
MCQNETREIRALLSEVTEALEDMVWQHCRVEPGEDGAELDSMAISANAEAIEILIRLGKLRRIGTGAGRRVLARHRQTQNTTSE